jgi:hypothetical protein
MKASNQTVIGLLALVLLLFGYSLVTTIGANTLHQRLSRLESSYQQLQARHRALAMMLLHADESPEAAARAKVELIRESLALPAPSSGDLRQTGAELNSPPPGLTSK